MHFEKEYLFFKKIMKKMNLRVLELTPPYKDSVDFDDKIRSLVYGAVDYPALLKNFLDSCKPNVIYKVFDEFSTSYLVFELPETSPRTHILIGPYILSPASEGFILKKAEEYNISPHHLPLFLQYFKNLPLITDSGMLFSVINSFCETIWGSADCFSLLETDSFLSAREIPSSISFDFSHHDNDFEIQQIENRYQAENALIQAVMRGQTHEIENFVTHLNFKGVEQRLADPVRNVKNYAIIMNTLLRKAAEGGLVHPYYINKTSSFFAQKIELLSSEHEAAHLLREMVHKYTLLVKNHSLKGYSPLVRKVMIQIDSNLSGEQTLKTHAKLLNINPCYLSTVFKKEVGVSLTDYVTQKRIEYALFLLNSTSLHIQTIAEYCGIPDVCYFSRLFRRLMGKSPSAYRKGIV